MGYTEVELERDLGLSVEAERVGYRFEVTRREFVGVLGAGVVLAMCGTALGAAPAGRGGRGGGGGIGGTGAANLGARLHIGKDGVVTVLCGKVECGQGVRAEVTQAVAEEMGVDVGQVRAILSDTELAPNDGPTVGSGTTPRTIPAVRQAAAAARELLVGVACKNWGVGAGDVTVKAGKVMGAGKALSFGELAGMAEEALKGAAVNRGVALREVKQWEVMGKPVLRPNARDIVMGRHVYPSDVVRPGMLYGKVLRAPVYGATLTAADVAEAQGMTGVVVVKDGNFVGVAAPTSDLAGRAIEAIGLSAKWDRAGQVPSATLAETLVKGARGVPENRFMAEMAAPAKAIKASYFIPYVQHAPMEPRAAVAEWVDGKLTVWTGTQNPFAVRQELATALRVSPENVRVIVNDFGGGFGGKHTGETAVEAARLAKGAGKPVSLRWTRAEEFMWSYFRPAGVMQAEASLDAAGKITSWHFININSGPSAVQTPYAVAKNVCQTVQSMPPLRHGSYRGLAATANVFARECFMDELAEAAGKDPLAFRQMHLEDARLRAVLESAAKWFDWAGRSKKVGVGVGLACGVEKGSYVAACCEVSVNKEEKTFKIEHFSMVFECGAIINPLYLMSQVQGSIMQGLGPVLREEMVFEGGRLENGSFAEYQPPRFKDMPPIDVLLLDRPDLASAGAGETPIVAVAPAVANAVSRAMGVRVRELPIRI